MLWSDLTLAENVVVPLQIYTGLAPREIQELVELKLAPAGRGPACSGAGIPETGRERRMRTPRPPAWRGSSSSCGGHPTGGTMNMRWSLRWAGVPVLVPVLVTGCSSPHPDPSVFLAA